MKKLIILLIAILPFVSSAQNTQVKVSLRNGTVIEGVMKELDALDHITLIVGGVETKIPMSHVAYVSNVGDQSQIVAESAVEQESEPKELVPVVVEDPLKDYKGFLLAKGNNVYVYCEDTEYERAGAEVLRNLLKKDGFWNVVDHMQEAHFTINYRVSLEYRDHAYVSISSWRVQQHELLYHYKSDESVSTNKNIAYNAYTTSVPAIQKKIEAGKLSNKLKERFTIK